MRQKCFPVDTGASNLGIPPCRAKEFFQGNLRFGIGDFCALRELVKRKCALPRILKEVHDINFTGRCPHAHDLVYAGHLFKLETVANAVKLAGG